MKPQGKLDRALLRAAEDQCLAAESILREMTPDEQQHICACPTCLIIHLSNEIAKSSDPQLALNTVHNALGDLVRASINHRDGLH